MNEEIMRVSAKGQLTIPVSIRKKLNIREGDYLRIQLDAGGIRLNKIEPIQPLSKADPIWRLIGIGASGKEDGSAAHDRLLTAEEVKQWQE